MQQYLVVVPDRAYGIALATGNFKKTYANPAEAASNTRPCNLLIKESRTIFVRKGNSLTYPYRNSIHVVFNVSLTSGNNITCKLGNY